MTHRSLGQEVSPRQPQPQSVQEASSQQQRRAFFDPYFYVTHNKLDKESSPTNTNKVSQEEWTWNHFVQKGWAQQLAFHPSHLENETCFSVAGGHRVMSSTASSEQRRGSHVVGSTMIFHCHNMQREGAPIALLGVAKSLLYQWQHFVRRADADADAAEAQSPSPTKKAPLSNVPIVAPSSSFDSYNNKGEEAALLSRWVTVSNVPGPMQLEWVNQLGIHPLCGEGILMPCVMRALQMQQDQSDPVVILLNTVLGLQQVDVIQQCLASCPFIGTATTNNIKTILYLHEVNVPEWHQQFPHLDFKRLFHQCTQVICNSYATAIEWQPYEDPTAPFLVLYPPLVTTISPFLGCPINHIIDNEASHLVWTNAKATSIGTNDFVIVRAGNICYNKQQLELLTNVICPWILSRNNQGSLGTKVNVKLYLIGAWTDEEYAIALQQFCSALSSSSSSSETSPLSLTIICTGAVPTLEPYLARAHVLISNSLAESFGMSVVEAMYKKKPVLVKKSLGGIGEIVKHLDNGFLCDTDQEMIVALDRIFQLGQSPDNLGSNPNCKAINAIGTIDRMVNNAAAFAESLAFPNSGWGTYLHHMLTRQRRGVNETTPLTG